MKKILLLCVLSLAALNAHATTYGGAPTTYYGGYPTEYAANNQAGALQPSRSAYHVYVDRAQIPEHVYTRTYPMGYGYSTNIPPTMSVPQGRGKTKKRFPTAQELGKKYYAALRLGYGGTYGWNKPFREPKSVMFNGVLGLYLPNQFRADFDLTYHTKETLYKEEGEPTFDYSQYDLGVNLYYDVNAFEKLKPFLGVGIGLTNSKASGTTQHPALKVSDDETNLSFAATAGIAYYLNRNVALEALMRARYILCDGDLYNIEGLVGVRYDF